MDGPQPEFLLPISDRAAFLARVYFGVTTALLVLCLVPFSARVYVRVWPRWRVGWDDALITLGLISGVVAWTMFMPEMFVTPRSISMATASYAVKLAYLSLPVWHLSITCVKVSVALTFLRIPQKKLWAVSLYAITAVHVVFFIANTIFNFTKCNPIEANWEIALAVTNCVDPSALRIMSNLGSAITIATDFLLSLAPIFILWSLRRPLRERILVCLLTGMGLLASVASVVKAIHVSSWGFESEDVWAQAISIATWTIIEDFLALFAACSPALKKPLQRLLGSIGVLLTGYNTHISFMDRSPITDQGSQEPEKEIAQPHPVYLREIESNTDKADTTESTSSTPSQADCRVVRGDTGNRDEA